MGIQLIDLVQYFQRKNCTEMMMTSKTLVVLLFLVQVSLIWCDKNDELEQSNLPPCCSWPRCPCQRDADCCTHGWCMTPIDGSGCMWDYKKLGNSTKVGKKAAKN